MQRKLGPPEAKLLWSTAIQGAESHTSTQGTPGVTGDPTVCITIIRDVGPKDEMVTRAKGAREGSAQVWIGLVHVRPVAGRDPFGGGQKGAYTNAVALAEGAEEFRELVQADLNEDGLRVVDIEDLLLEAQYRAEGRINTDLDFLIKSLSSDKPVIFDTFDVYLNDDA